MAEKEEVDATAKDKIRRVSNEELQAAFSGPAIYSNRSFATNTPAGMRIAFCEELPGSIGLQFRAAVTLSYPDAKALNDLLLRQLEGIQFSVIEKGKVEPNG